jgi:hypothetical protein
MQAEGEQGGRGVDSQDEDVSAMVWSVEPAADGIGSWLVGRAADAAEVIVPPGATTTWAELKPWTEHPGIAGWRWGRWEWEPGGERPNLDHDPPNAGSGTSSTREVLVAIDPELHEVVREILEQQLARLESIDLLPDLTQDRAFEAAAHRNISSLASMRSDLAQAFPETHGFLADDGELLRARYTVLRDAAEDIPETVAEIEQRLMARVDDEGLGGWELLRLLKRRVIWRALDRVPRPVAITVLAACRDPHSEMHELAERYLRDRSIRARWPTTSLEPHGITERVRTIVRLSRLPAQDDAGHPPISMVAVGAESESPQADS